MRVWLCQIGENISAGDHGTGLRRTGLMARILTSMGHEVYWWSSNFNHSQKHFENSTDNWLEIKGVGFVKKLSSLGYAKNASVRRMFHHLHYSFCLARHIENEIPPDLIICSFPTPENAFILSRFARKHDVRIIIDVRDMWPFTFRYYMPKFTGWMAPIVFFPYYWMSKFIFSEADHIIAVSDPFLKWALEIANRERNKLDQVVYLVKDKSHTGETNNSCDWLSSIGFNEESINVIFAGGFSKKNNFTHIASAWAAVSRKYPTIKLYLCGSGDDAQKVRTLFKDYQNVAMLGELKSSHLSVLYSRCDVSIAPYAQHRIDFESSIPTKIIESISYGVPVLTSLAGLTKDLIEEFQLGCYFENEEGFLQGLEQMLKGRKEYCKNCEWVNQTLFSIENNLTKYLESLAFDFSRMR